MNTDLLIWINIERAAERELFFTSWAFKFHKFTLPHKSEYEQQHYNDQADNRLKQLHSDKSG